MYNIQGEVRVIQRDVILCLREMFEGSRLDRMNRLIQHGDTSCLAHTVGVVYCALAIAERLHINVRKRELIRGGILHDYFLYDWHDGNGRQIHGFTHPSAALVNADADFDLTDREKDIIKKHMFPLTILPPKSREGWLICIADKICACREAFNKDTYPEIKRMIKRQQMYNDLKGNNRSKRG